MQLYIKIIYAVLAVLLVCTIIFLCYFIPQNLSAEVATCKPILETQIIQMKLPRMIFR